MAYYMCTSTYIDFLSQCDWIPIKSSPDALKALIISDTHLLGHRKSIWIDRWLREWEMYQSFKAVISIHKPEVVFVLGKDYSYIKFIINKISL